MRFAVTATVAALGLLVAITLMLFAAEVLQP